MTEPNRSPSSVTLLTSTKYGRPAANACVGVIVAVRLSRLYETEAGTAAPLRASNIFTVLVFTEPMLRLRAKTTAGLPPVAKAVPKSFGVVERTQSLVPVGFVTVLARKVELTEYGAVSFEASLLNTRKK